MKRFSTDRGRVNLLHRFLILLIFGTAVVFLIRVWAGVSFGWFSSNKNAAGSGMNIQTAPSGTFEIRASAEGENIGKPVLVSDMTTLELPGTAGGIYPGVSGSFTFYVSDGTGEVQEGAYFYRVTLTNNDFHECKPNEGEEYREGFYPDTTPVQRENAIRYMTSHILFFTSRTDGKYSGWIRPDEPIRHDASGTGASRVTVYWVWVDEYGQIFGETIPEASRLIEETTRAEIADYYESRMSEITENGEQSREAYNNADTQIGITVKYIRFDLTVSKM